MPTLKPRFSITLDEDTLAVLDRYAAASGTPRASVVAQIIESTASELSKAARMMEIANAATPELLRKVSADLGEATQQAMQLLLPVDDQYRGLIRKVSHKVQWTAGPAEKRLEGSGGALRKRGGPGPAKRRPPPGSDPHLLTGGSKS